MQYYDRVQRSFRDGGLLGVLGGGVRHIYRALIRPIMPVAGYVSFNGTMINRPIRIGDPKLPAGWVPYPIADLSDYESALVHGLREHVVAGDKVVIVGGGWGVTAVVAARQVGPEGSVVCFEGSQHRVKDIRRAAQLNDVSIRVEVIHAIVARAIAVDGATEGTTIMPPEGLPACDVLELDCEGAEIEILTEMAVRPRVILVESHGLYGTPTQDVIRTLESISYRVARVEIAESQLEEFCRRNDIFVAVAVQHGDSPASGDPR